MKGTLRVTGGAFRGRRLKVPPGARPTEAQVREALFSIWRERLAGCRFLDLFAGSGAVTLEALGRGAQQVIGVDADSRALAILRENAVALVSGAESTGAESLRCLRLRLPGRRGALARQLGSSCDLAFADPPYDFDGFAGLLQRLSEVLDPQGEAAVEHRGGAPLPETVGSLRLQDRRTYGSCSLSFYRFGEEP